MLWHGVNNKNCSVKKKKYYKYHLLTKFNLTDFNLKLMLFKSWNIVCFNNFQINFYNIFLFSNLYFFNVAIYKNFTKIYFCKESNVLKILFKFNNNFFKIYWFWFYKVFYCFYLITFKKFKFKGKGYYIFKNKRNTITFKFGYSHRYYLYNYIIFIKVTSKTSLILFGINYKDVIDRSFNLYYTRTYNIFTGKGIRFNKQTIYKKLGKVSTYR
jgi:hypothetical protein